jgi:hypothetical protein
VTISSFTGIIPWDYIRPRVPQENSLSDRDPLCVIDPMEENLCRLLSAPCQFALG